MQTSSTLTHPGKMRHTAPWHYVDVPLDEPKYDERFAGDEPKKGYIVPKIPELKAVLKDGSRPVEERRQALLFLVHFIEDLHMPLRVGDNHDRGGERHPSPMVRPRIEHASRLGPWHYRPRGPGRRRLAGI